MGRDHISKTGDIADENPRTRKGNLTLRALNDSVTLIIRAASNKMLCQRENVTLSVVLKNSTVK